jgi:hypothetical protein
MVGSSTTSPRQKISNPKSKTQNLKSKMDYVADSSVVERQKHPFSPLA